MRFGRDGWHIALVWLSVVGIACSSAESTVPLGEVSLLPYVGRLVTIDVIVEGQTLPFLLDTGGGETLLTPEVARQLGCEPADRSVGFRMSGERVEFSRCADVTLSLATQEFLHRDMAVFDLGSLLPTDWPPLAGLVSLKTFAQQPVTLDLSNARLIMESPGSLQRRVATMAPLETRMATGQDGMSVTMFIRMTQPAPGWYLFDSANLDVVRVSTHLLARSDSGEVDEGTIQMAGAPGIDGQWRAVEMIYDGALSEEFLRTWVITLDLAEGKAWVARAASREAA